MPAGGHYAEVSTGPGGTAKSENRTSNPARCGEQHMTPTWDRGSLGKPATRAVCQCPSGRGKAVDTVDPFRTNRARTASTSGASLKGISDQSDVSLVTTVLKFIDSSTNSIPVLIQRSASKRIMSPA